MLTQNILALSNRQMLQLLNDHQILLISCRTSHLSLKIPPLPLTNHEAKPCVTTMQKLNQHSVVQGNLALYHLHLLEQLSFLHSHLERRCNRQNIVQFGVQYAFVPIFHSHSWDRYALYTMHDHLDVLLFLICMFEQRCPGWWNGITLAFPPGKHFKTCFVLVTDGSRYFAQGNKRICRIIKDFPCCSLTFSTEG